MNSISRIYSDFYHRLRFRNCLNKIVRYSHGDVVQAFDLPKQLDSFFLDCDAYYARPPQEVVETEMKGSAQDQARAVVKDWSFWPRSDLSELVQFVKYVIFLREKHRQGRPIHTSTSSKVKDYIYEM